MESIEGRFGPASVSHDGNNNDDVMDNDDNNNLIMTIICVKLIITRMNKITMIITNTNDGTNDDITRMPTIMFI